MTHNSWRKSTNDLFKRETSLQIELPVPRQFLVFAIAVCKHEPTKCFIHAQGPLRVVLTIFHLLWTRTIISGIFQNFTTIQKSVLTSKEMHKTKESPEVPSELMYIRIVTKISKRFYRSSEVCNLSIFTHTRTTQKLLSGRIFNTFCRLLLHAIICEYYFRWELEHLLNVCLRNCYHVPTRPERRGWKQLLQHQRPQCMSYWCAYAFRRKVVLEQKIKILT